MSDWFETFYKERHEREREIERHADKVAIAASMLEDGMSVEKIIKYTNLPLDEIKQMASQQRPRP